MPKTIIRLAAHAEAARVTPILRHAGATNICGTFYPEDDSAPVVSIGSRASEERIERLAAKHGLDARALLYFARRSAGGRHD